MFVQVQSRWNRDGSFEITSLFLPLGKQPWLRETRRRDQKVTMESWKAGGSSSNTNLDAINLEPLIYFPFFDESFFFLFFFLFETIFSQRRPFDAVDDSTAIGNHRSRDTFSDKNDVKMPDDASENNYRNFSIRRFFHIPLLFSRARGYISSRFFVFLCSL